jgi:hypothetical protein
MEVDEWAGSTPIYSNRMGNMAPKQTLLNTMSVNAEVTATVSKKGVLKKIARQNPATLRIADKATAILNSRAKN